MRKNRLFIALTLPYETKQSIIRFSRPFSRQHPEMKLEPAKKLHITMKFLGWTSQDPSDIASRLRNMKSELKHVPISFSEFDSFKGKKTIYYVGVKMNKQLLTLYQAINSAMHDAFRFKKESRVFIPHVTIARVKRPIKSSWKPSHLPKSFTARTLVLMQSRLKQKGSDYKTLHRITLK